MSLCPFRHVETPNATRCVGKCNVLRWQMQRVALPDSTFWGRFFDVIYAILQRFASEFEIAKRKQNNQSALQKDSFTFGRSIR